MRISRPAVRTLLISGLLGAVALTTAGCQDDSAKPAKPAASSPAATPTQSPMSSPSPSDSPSPSASPTPTPTPTHSAPPAAAAKPPVPKAPPKPKMTAPVPPPPMDGGGNKGGSDVYYKNCTAARAAGVTPLHRGDPGYAPHLDRDGDGIACER
ncbi:excalibur calcium-binding domain-containing protein [Streptomyces hundungensis]|uniref:excalibur calcium-binding domain-containing protein n=1 Tax=Streptomyces hundungensis TaxID=1077946 RepID=UPI0031ED428C